MDTESFLLPVVDVVEETAEAVSVSLEVTPEAAPYFDYKPGQFLTVAVPSDQTGLAARCYSLSSSPLDEGPITITVKRTADGYASNWIAEHLEPGDRLRVLPPSGIFTPKSLDDDLLLFAGGSGITPVISIVRTALRKGSGQVVLFYANRDQDSVIFGRQLAELAREHADRFVVVHWLESVQGLPTQEQLATFARQFADHTAFVCGPGPYMKAATGALKELGFPRERRHQEKFVSLGGNPFGDVEEMRLFQEGVADADDHEEGDAAPGPSGPVHVDVELDGNHYSFDDYDPRMRLLDFLESKGLDAPFSCREGQCSACACVVLEGEVSMAHNEVLEEEDLADGIRLACQSTPRTEKLRITYNG